MLRRTHLALGFAAALYFLPHIQDGRLIFLGVVLLASLLPDIESGFSAVRRHGLFHLQPTKPIYHKNWILHTYSILLITTAIIALYYPFLALPFFLGYSLHIFLDSFTPTGIKPFWPLKHKMHGKIVPGSKIDKMLFLIFLGAGVILLFNFIMYA